MFLKKKKQLIIKRKWLNHLTPLSLAIWWCDDGTLTKSGGILCTNGFSKDYVIILVKYLEVVWGVNSNCYEIKPKKRLLESGNYSKGIYYLIRFSSTELKKFFRIILPYLPVKEMIYKILLIYNNPDFQQRWISEIKQLINPSLIDFVDDEFAKKITRIKEKSVQRKI